jgi:hypothetical protein
MWSSMVKYGQAASGLVNVVSGCFWMLLVVCAFHAIVSAAVCHF